MFGKLKDKLKSALSIFSKKAEEAAEVKVVEVIKEAAPAVKPAEIKKGEKKKEQKIKEEQKKAPEKKEVVQKKPEVRKTPEKKDSSGGEKAEYQKELIAEKKTDIAEKPVQVEIKEEPTIIPEEKKSFFTKIKDTFRKKEEVPAEVIPEKIPEMAAEPEQEIEKTAEPTPELAMEKSFFGKIKQAITTKTISAEKFEELFWDLEIVLLENNVSVEVIDKIKKDLQTELVDKPLPWDVESKILDTLKKTLFDVLTFPEINLIEKASRKKPLIIAFFGINGTGKTTSIAKLTAYFHQHHKSVVLAAGDTFRAAAIQQLEEHAHKLGVKMIKHDYGADAAAVAFDAVNYAQKNAIDVVLIDTAGRLHSNTNLMAELEKIIRVAKPDLKIFVGESITGNDCIEQARQFNQLVEMDGAILTKADVDEKGGAPLSIAYTIRKPILFLGVGQRYEDLEKFEAQTILKRLGL